MPWNDHANPGPWGTPPGGDDGRKPDGDEPPRREEPRRRPPPPPGGPDLADLQRRLAEAANRLFRGPAGQGIRPPAIAAIAAVAFLAWILTGVYTVQAYQEAVVTRFGGYARSVGPGLHYHLPIPIERAELVSVTNQNKTVVGGVAGAEAPDESLMLTGDENIVDLSFAVQWHVADAAAYLFRVRDPSDAVKAVAESAMREVVGRSALKSILTNGRGDVQTQTLALMQRILDSYHAGVTIDAVQIQNANPPAEVVPAYQDIAKAGQDAQSSINDANTYRNRVVNEAKGDAAKIVQAAQGYREQVVREAQGQADRFNQVYAQYRRAPAVTRERLYIQTMQQVLSHTHKVIIDAKGATAPIILPPDAFRVAAPEAAPTAPAAAPAPGNGQ
ncbi:MAG: FtsH protease activity modulator HflK [Caulobacteraceae bacterium]